MALMFTHNRYLRMFGVRRLGQVENPPVRPVSKYALPRGTVYHYMPVNEVEIGPDASHPALQAAQRLIFIDHVTDLMAKEGNPRPTYKLPAPMVQKYRRENMLIRPLRDYDAVSKDIINMVVVNYAIIGHMYKYQRSALMRWWYWKNIRTTLWMKINTLRTEHERHHIVPFNIPQTLPSIADLRKAERGMTPFLTRVFDSRERMDLLDLWTWIGPNRHTCPMGRLDPLYYSEVDLLIQRDTGWLVINLGMLDSWRSSNGTASMESFVVDAGGDMDISLEEFDQLYADQVADMPDIPDVSMEAAGNALDPKILQLRFLKMLIRVIDKTKVSVLDVQSSDDQDVIDETDDERDAETRAVIDGDEEARQVLVEDEEKELAESLDAPSTLEETVLTDDDGELIIETGNTEKEEIGSNVSTRQTAPTLTSVIEERAGELAERGLYTRAQHARIVRQAEAYKTIPDPWNSELTIEQSLSIPTNDLLLTETEDYPAPSALIRDKSMLKSSVETMDSQYVEKVLRKDILNAVISVQKAGIAVSGYKVETVRDAVSHYEEHTVQLTPVVGKSSTIRFRVPVVDKRGTYVSNGSRYRLRAQKGDLPIVKVSPTRVALTSYYSKLFVDRSDRAVFNHDAWVTKQIIARGMDPSDNSITSVKTADVTDPSVKLPAIYAAIGGRVISFTGGQGIRFWFDYRNRARSKLFDMGVLEAIEAANPGMVVCGILDKRYIVVDSNNVFYAVDPVKGQMDEMGRIEKVIGLDNSKSPTPLAEVSIFGKVMPIGVVIAYMVGFDGMLSMVKARHRVVDLGSRLNLSDDEYAVRFLDQTVVFDKHDEKAAMLISGFVHYHKQVRQYSRHTFNDKDVYFALFDANGIGLRYLREFDLMNAMWVDPITKELLAWMREPQEFIPLLLRAVEMLVDRHVPDRIETEDGIIEGLERAKGYERIPGAVYSELVRAVRVYNARSGGGNSQVTMKPHDVWVNIVQDPAAALVDDINPIQNLKQKEIITYGGRGGRSSRSMTADSRLYKEADLGFISESTVDSGDVAVITYMSPNANITSVRGTVKRYDPSNPEPTRLMSTASLVSPFADRDDPKRVSWRPSIER